MTAGTVVGLVLTRPLWGPTVAEWIDPSHKANVHDRDHGEEKPDAATRIELSEQAQQNIGLTTINLAPATFARTITVPGIIIEKHGHSDVEVTAPIAGIVRYIHFRARPWSRAIRCFGCGSRTKK